jgi:hypothetical protein
VVVYREVHAHTYRATLDSDYSLDPFAPTYTFTNVRHGGLEGATYDGRELILINDAKRAQLSPPPGGRQPLATGQGLDRFVKENMGPLAAGETLRVQYAIPRQQETYEFRVQAVGKPSPDRLKVLISIDNWFLRLFAPELECDYDVKTGRLLRYRGLSNIEDGEGDFYDVEIFYSYPDGGP